MVTPDVVFSMSVNGFDEDDQLQEGNAGDSSIVVAPAPMPAPAGRELKLSANEIHIADFSSLGSNVRQFVTELFSVPAPLTDLAHIEELRVPHPSDANEYANIIFRSASADTATPAGLEARKAHVKQAETELLQRWKAACQRFESLPSLARFGSVAAECQRLQPPRSDVAALAAGRDACAAASAADVVMQLAVHSPHEDFARTQVILASENHSLEQLQSVICCANDRYAAQQLTAPVQEALFFLGGVVYERKAPGPGSGPAESVTRFLRKQAAEAEAHAEHYLEQRGLSGVGVRAPAMPVPEVRLMQHCLVRDLTIQPVRSGLYLFSHAGACEHMLVVEDVRLRNALDPPRSQSPTVIWARPHPIEKCCICAARPAAKVAFGDPLAPVSPAFFCDLCFDALHCDGTGRLLPEAQGIDVYDRW